jgi:hypothetical protein
MHINICRQAMQPCTRLRFSLAKMLVGALPQTPVPGFARELIAPFGSGLRVLADAI